MDAPEETQPTGPEVHKTAIVSDEAVLGDGVVVGPYCVIEGPVHLGAGTRLGPHVHVLGDTRLGENNTVHKGAVLGDLPQDLSFDPDTPTGVRIGASNTFREYTQVHRATKPETHTTVGNRNFIMVGTHFAHDCVVGDRNVFGNNTLLGGHVELANRIVMAGGVAIHQFCRVGELVMIGGLSATSKDIPPFMMLTGAGRVTGVNRVGLRRAPDVTVAARRAIVDAFKVLFRSELMVSAALAKLEAEDPTPEVQKIIDFCRATKRGICKGGVGYTGM